MGPMNRSEKIVVGTLLTVIFLWATKDIIHTVDISFIALAGIAALLVTHVLEWKELTGDSNAWSTFIWYGGLVNMASALGETGLTKLFAERSAAFTGGMAWMAALGILLLIYFYSHYFFASITAHVLAMYVPFLAVTLTAGAPAGLAVLCLNYFSTLNASLTHFGTTPGPIYFGLGYVKQSVWWRIGLIASILNIVIWSTVGLGWWKLLGWW